MYQDMERRVVTVRSVGSDPIKTVEREVYGEWRKMIGLKKVGKVDW